MRAGTLLWISVCLIPLTSHAAAIHDAAKKGDTAAITAALDMGANVNDPDGFATPLYYAVSRQHLDAAKLLIDRGADVNVGSKISGPPLKAAVAKSKPELITLLLAHGADPKVTAGDETVLHQAVRLPEPGPSAPKLAFADVENGRAFFGRNCDGCHTNEPGKGAMEGPNLWQVVGRDKASAPADKYSKTLQAWEGVWTYEDLNTYLYGPTLTTPGVLMETPGVPDETERVDLIAYLRTLSDKPISLP